MALRNGALVNAECPVPECRNAASRMTIDEDNAVMRARLRTTLRSSMRRPFSLELYRGGIEH
jgi:hypothetical protein